MSYLDLKDKKVVVTGATHGIGEAVMEAFVREGAFVFFCGRDLERGQAIVQKFEGSVDFFALDLTQPEKITEWFEHIRATTDQIDCLVNNAGMGPRVAIDQLTVEQWDRFFNLNIRAYFLCAQAALPMLPEGSSIVNVGSITFQLGFTPMTAYVSTKGAILGFTRSLAREIGSRKIRVNTLSPGWTMTERQLHDYIDDHARQLIRERQCDPSPLEPSEVAEAVLFLASHRSSAINGQNICADKGWVHN